MLRLSVLRQYPFSQHSVQKSAQGQLNQDNEMDPGWRIKEKKDGGDREDRLQEPRTVNLGKENP